jgi:hypothetical protein
MKFEIVGSVVDAAVMAAGPSVRVRSYLRKAYGPVAKDERDCYGPPSERCLTQGGVTLV